MMKFVAWGVLVLVTVGVFVSGAKLEKSASSQDKMTSLLASLCNFGLTAALCGRVIGWW
jgi:hypothetical protein